MFTEQDSKSNSKSEPSSKLIRTMEQCLAPYHRVSSSSKIQCISPTARSGLDHKMLPPYSDCKCQEKTWEMHLPYFCSCLPNTILLTASHRITAGESNLQPVSGEFQLQCLPGTAQHTPDRKAFKSLYIYQPHS